MSFATIVRGFLNNSPISIFRIATRSSTARSLTTNILIVGKKSGGEKFISDGYAEYEKRLTPVMKINTIFLKSDEALVEATKAMKGTGGSLLQLLLLLLKISVYPSRMLM
jgi:hypothetical protein